MSAPKTILVPTDFGEAAAHALDRAVEIARAVQARIILLHACPLPYWPALEGAMVPNGDLVEAMRDAGHKNLARTVARIDPKIDIQPRLLLGDPRTCILDAAKEFGADMIVMGTHGRRGLARVFLGSTAEAVVRAATVPVLTTRALEESA